MRTESVAAVNKGHGHGNTSVSVRPQVNNGKLLHTAAHTRTRSVKKVAPPWICH